MSGMGLQHMPAARQRGVAIRAALISRSDVKAALRPGVDQNRQLMCGGRA